MTGAYISYNNKNLDKYIFYSRNSKKSNMIAVLIENSNGKYKHATDDVFPGYEYSYNQFKSGCMNNSGNKIEDSLLYDQDNKKVTIKVQNTSRCYLYFDKWKNNSLATALINRGDMWQSGLDGDGYRYVGSGAIGESTNPNNFICFGTTDNTECTSNSKYLYRIIGVFPDEYGTYYTKVVKAFWKNSSIWTTNGPRDIFWGNSDLFKGLNGDYFLNNTNYSYLQDSIWADKITNWTWSTVRGTNKDYNLIRYAGYNASNIFLHEMMKDTNVYESDNWTNPVAKIGLMYLSDLLLSLGSESLLLTSEKFSDSDIDSWITSDSGVLNEWLITSDEAPYADHYKCHTFPYNTHGYGLAFGVNSCDESLPYRPVFYINSDEILFDGNGSIENPYRLFNIKTDYEKSNKLSVTFITHTAEGYIEAAFSKGKGKLKKFCLNGQASINDCNWLNVEEGQVIYEFKMEPNHNYYLHVIDDYGYIATASYSSYNVNYNMTLENNLIKYGDLWQSNLIDDGYRFAGEMPSCYYKDADYTQLPKDSNGSLSCPDLFDCKRYSLEDGTIEYGLMEYNKNDKKYEYTCGDQIYKGTIKGKQFNNYICFGTTDKYKCQKNSELYLYRIIGVFPDSEGNNHLKLIKESKIGNYVWHSDWWSADIEWGNSELFAGLNGDYFLTNTTYNYLQESKWLNIITDWTWNAANTILFESDEESLDYVFSKASGVYYNEMNKKVSYSLCFNNYGDSVECNSGKNTTVNAKIGLLYASDYALSLAGVDKINDNDYKKYSKSWVLLSDDEWIIPRVGKVNGHYNSYFISSTGKIAYDIVGREYAVRPVFYLNSNIYISGGLGTYNNPFTITFDI